MRENGRSNLNGESQENQERKKKWTVMVYLAGDSNLTANCISVLQQLEAVKYNDEICVLACFDSNTPWPKGARYLAINCRRRKVDNGMDWEIHNDLIPPNDRGHKLRPPNFCHEEGDGDETRVTRSDVPQGLTRFIEWSMTSEHNPKSERHMLILYGHGPVVAGQTFLAKDNPRSSLRFEDLKNVLAPHFGGDKPKLDILACQNCVMNGIETAYEVRNQVAYMIGSQGLVLAAGWPYEKMIGALVNEPDLETPDIATNLLKACARNLLDFSVMDRSSEQSVCNLSSLQEGKSIMNSVRELSSALQEGLAFHDVQKAQKNGNETNEYERVLRYPAIVDAVKLARLEAQSYWGEIFVDLYDFCERLMKKCNEVVCSNNKLFVNLGCGESIPKKYRETDLLRVFREIARCCIDITNEIERMVPVSYYIGAELQYSHGLSIFFPWTLPTEPYFFTQTANGDFTLRTVFDTYRHYSFSQDSGWGDFLKSFFKATLRKVRRSHREFVLRSETESLTQGLIQEVPRPPAEVLTIDLQKSSSDTGRVDHDIWSNIKNYPRRNYLSPSDCPRKIDFAGCQKSGTKHFVHKDSPPVSYLGWNISGLVADVIAQKPVGEATNGKSKAVAKPAGAPEVVR